jgi:RNA polymerase sigma-70 factor (ECF subfamily)
MVDSGHVPNEAEGGSALVPHRTRAERERALLEALRQGDESAFSRLVDLHHRSMVRVARFYVATVAAAEEVAQEAWVGVLEGLDRFEGRCSLKAWIFTIVANCAKSRGVHDRRSVPLSSLAAEDDDGTPSVDPERFLEEGHPRWPGHWAQPPRGLGRT